MKFSILSRRRYSHEDLKTTAVQCLKHVKHYNYFDPFCRISKLQVVFRLKVVVYKTIAADLSHNPDH